MNVLTTTAVVRFNIYNTLADAKQNKLFKKGDLKLWHVEMPTFV